MTPAEIVYMVDGYNERRKDDFEQVKWAIHQAGVLNSYALRDPKSYPDFNEFMYGRSEKQQQSPEQMLQVVKTLNAAFGGVDKTNPGI